MNYQQGMVGNGTQQSHVADNLIDSQLSLQSTVTGN